MISTFTQHIYAALVGVVVLSSCSRPVAYFQRSPVEPSTTSNTQAITISTLAVATLEQPLMKGSPPITQSEVYVRNDSKLATNKNLTKRMTRVKQLLASTVEMHSPEAIQATHKMNLMERLVLKKINKQISRQLEPKQPEKAMISKGKLIGGSVLLIAGLIMLIAGTGTVAFIGLIIGLVGALGILVGVLGV